MKSKRIASLIFAALTALLLMSFLYTCSVNDGTPESDGDSECNCQCPDGDGENETVEADETESDEIEAENDGDEEIEKETDTESEPESEIEAEVEEENAPLCGSGLRLACGDSLAHNTNVQGRVDEWPAYSCSARLESGRETIYEFSTETDCSVVLLLSDLSEDIDLFLLSECDAFSCLHMSSTPLDIQEGERVEFEAEAGRIYFVSVDGYEEAAGAYTIEANCSCPADGDTENQ